MIDVFLHVMLEPSLRYLVKFKAGNRNLSVLSFAFRTKNESIYVQPSLQTFTRLPKKTLDTHSHFSRWLVINRQAFHTTQFFLDFLGKLDFGIQKKKSELISKKNLVSWAPIRYRKDESILLRIRQTKIRVLYQRLRNSRMVCIPRLI